MNNKTPLFVRIHAPSKTWLGAALISLCVMQSTLADTFEPPEEPSCTLDVSASYVPLGQNFTFGVGVYAGLPRTNPSAPRPPFSVVFYGTKDGIEDIPGGYPHNTSLRRGYNVLTGYGNPITGGYTGTYVRYAVVKDRDGNAFCVTDTVTTTLQ
jgi:hypothetical protein